MLLTDTCPSWLYEIKVGGTTTWERWDALREDGTLNAGDDDGGDGMVSFNHYAAGAVGDFLYRRVAGIEPLEAGYKRFRVQPLLPGINAANAKECGKTAALSGAQPADRISSASARVTTVYGPAEVSWKLEKNPAEARKPDQKIFNLDVKVPLGSSCEVILPDGRKTDCGSGSHSFSCVLT